MVIDEIAGQCLALLALPRPGWAGAALAFALFRLLDVTKPGPIGWADRQGGAWGIMADDIIAGFIACLIVGAAHAIWPKRYLTKRRPPWRSFARGAGLWPPRKAARAA